MGGKSSAPAAPDYTPIANATAQQAQLDYALGQQQLQWGQSQFDKVWPYARNYLTAQNAATAQEQQFAQQQHSFYTRNFQPIEKQFATEASNYNSPAQANINAGNAMADVANAYTQSNTAALQQLESYGIDPSQTRYAALDLGNKVSQAAATAAAGTQSRLNTQATGMALQGEAINIGSGYPSNIATSYNTATNAGASGINTANNTNATGSNITGSPLGFLGAGTSGYGQSINALNTGYNNAATTAQINNQASQNMMSGIGSLAGLAIGGAMML